jgi:putative tryptophan/tyrosine transport system substrate-binding protein
MRRREFIAALGATAWPLAAPAQQRAAPVIGYLGGGTFDRARAVIAAVHRGLSERGYVEGRNLAVEYRWAEDHVDRLPALAEDLVRRQVAVIIVTATPALLAARAATQSVPIVFTTSLDPVEAGLVASFKRPGGQLTGVYSLQITVAPKRLELLHELLPKATLFAYLVNPINITVTDAETEALQSAAQTLGVRLLILNASDPAEFEGAFSTLVQERAAGLVVGGDALYFNYYDQVVALAERYRVPAIFTRREATEAGGLLNYGTDYGEVWRELGVYVGRILNGEKPDDLPMQQVTKMQLSINLKTAKTLGLTFPTALLVRADEVIE